MKATDKIKIGQLVKGDTFFYNGNRYDVVENSEISSSFNEVIVIAESVEINLRLKRDTVVRLNESVVSVPVRKTITESSSSMKKTRNERGTLISVNMYNPEELEERKLTKDEIKKRDNCATKLLDSPEFKERYSDGDNINPPGRTIDDVAYGICTNRAKGIEKGKGKKKVQKESYTVKSLDRINTLRNAIRRLPNEEL